MPKKISLALMSKDFNEAIHANAVTMLCLL